MIVDGMMHLEVVGEFWDGLLEEVLAQYDAAGIDKGVVLNTWMPSRESNDRTLEACRRYPDRFLPFGHVRPVDEWRDELARITQEFGWTGLKLHQGELRLDALPFEPRRQRLPPSGAAPAAAVPPGVVASPSDGDPGQPATPTVVNRSGARSQERAASLITLAVPSRCRSAVIGSR